jgi:hypothetical protein
MDAPTGSILAYATAPGSVAADGTGRNGLYTSMLLKHISTPGLEIGRLFRQVRIDVVKSSGKRQTPWESSSLMGDFYFTTKRGIAVKERPLVESEKPIKESPKYTSISPKVSRPEEVERDRSFVKYANGVVYDKNTSLEWYAGPDKNTSWYDAKGWVESLNVAGGGWRMPMRNELKTLYQKNAGTRHMTPLLKTTGWFVWSGETKGWNAAWPFFFGGGKWYYRSRGFYHDQRGFAVRSRR